MSDMHSDSERPPASIGAPYRQPRPQGLQGPDPAVAESEEIQSDQDVRSWGVVFGSWGAKPSTPLLYLGVIVLLIVVASLLSYVSG